MWFYMKYIVKNHSDLIFLARLCSYGITDISQGVINYLSSQIIEHKQTIQHVSMTIKIRVCLWDRHKHVTELNRTTRTQSSHSWNIDLQQQSIFIYTHNPPNRNDLTEILLKVALNAITPNPSIVILIINIAYKPPT